MFNREVSFQILSAKMKNAGGSGADYKPQGTKSHNQRALHTLAHKQAALACGKQIAEELVKLSPKAFQIEEIGNRIHQLYLPVRSE